MGLEEQSKLFEEFNIPNDYGSYTLDVDND